MVRKGALCGEFRNTPWGWQVLATLVSYDYHFAPTFCLMGKLCGRLWQVFLTAGPTYSSIRLYIRRVRFIITDLGTEKDLVDATDVLVDLLQFIKVDVPRDAHTFKWPMSGAFWIGGWRRIWDGLIKFG